jgi:hypothetical protein
MAEAAMLNSVHDEKDRIGWKEARIFQFQRNGRNM